MKLFDCAIAALALGCNFVGALQRSNGTKIEPADWEHYEKLGYVPAFLCNDPKTCIYYGGNGKKVLIIINLPKILQDKREVHVKKFIVIERYFGDSMDDRNNNHRESPFRVIE
eukprot:Pgem_evm1s8955